MLPVAETDLFLNTPKRAVSAIEWRSGLTKKDAQWWKWDSALEVDGTIPEGARVILQWRPAVGAAPEKMNLTLLYRQERIYGIDLDEASRHTNKAGKGRPLYRKMIDTPAHEHTWSEDGYGYAEPLDPVPGTLAALFGYFCHKANLMVDGGFKSPPSQQFSLDLI